MEEEKDEGKQEEEEQEEEEWGDRGEGGDIQTDEHKNTNIALYRLNWPRGKFSEIYILILTKTVQILLTTN